MTDLAGPDPLRAWRCNRCGDTFTTDAGGDVACPSCGSRDADEAREPLL